jgi:hypothetical protein
MDLAMKPGAAVKRTLVSTGDFKGFPTPRATELLMVVAVAQQHRVVYPAGWTLPRQRRVKHMPVLAVVRRLPRLVSPPGILGP